MNQEMYNEAIHASVLSKSLITELLACMQYNNFSFINWSIEVLRIIKIRLERGDKITDEVSGITYSTKTFREFVTKNFSSYIVSQVFANTKKTEKVYFSLEACEDGYNLVMAPSADVPTYEWISSLSKRFSLVQMISTGIVYIKDVKTNTYQPFISGKGKYCRYDKAAGKILEI